MQDEASDADHHGEENRRAEGKQPLHRGPGSGEREDSQKEDVEIIGLQGIGS